MGGPLGWVALALIASSALALDNGLAVKPAMGYNTWSSYGVHGMLDAIRNCHGHVSFSRCLGLPECSWT